MPRDSFDRFTISSLLIGGVAKAWRRSSSRRWSASELTCWGMSGFYHAMNTHETDQYDDLDAFRRHAPVGRCIYCGRSDIPLSDEHTLPDGMGGKQILPQASCSDCQKIVNEDFEQYCQRELFGNARTLMGLRSGKRSRRRRPRPRQRLRIRKKGGAVEDLYPELDELPLVLAIPAFPEPYILADQPAPETIPGGAWIYGQKTVGPHLERFEAEALLTPTIHPSKFARFLAKIAHAHATAILGDVFKPLLPPLILGTHRAWADYVGGILEPEPPNPEFGHIITIFQAVRDTDMTPYAVAEIRLFAFLGSPVHHVVIGEMIKPWPPELTISVPEDVHNNRNTNGARRFVGFPTMDPADRPPPESP